MKIIKRILKVILIILIVVLVVFALNYLRLNIYYQMNYDKYKEVLDVNGTKDKYVPQSITYSSKYNVMIQTSYNKKHKVSRIYITDLNSKKLVKTINLLKEDNSINNNHVGGITTDNKTVWITNDYEVSEYSLDEIINTNKKEIKSLKDTKLLIRGDFCLFKNNTLYIGDFSFYPFYKVPDNNPLMFAYTNETIDYNQPSYILSLPNLVQGMEIDKDNNMLFTQSFTYFHNSKLLIYKDILKEKTSTYNLKGKKIPYYKLTKDNQLAKIYLPPMAEGMFIKDDKLYILFESAADAYINAMPKIDKIITFNYKEELK